MDFLRDVLNEIDRLMGGRLKLMAFGGILALVGLLFLGWMTQDFITSMLANPINR